MFHLLGLVLSQRLICEDQRTDGLNWYVYCGNNPLTFIDPSGLEGEETDAVPNSKPPQQSADTQQVTDAELKVEAEKNLEYLELATKNYGDYLLMGTFQDMPEGFTDVTDQYAKEHGLNFSDDTGLDSRLYQHEDGRFVLAFTGSYQPNDWKDNGKQAFTGVSEQYDSAARLTMSLLESSDSINSDNLTLTGHSLGGGLASSVSSKTGLEAIAFASPGIHQNQIGRFGGSRVTNSYVRGDAVDAINDVNIPIPFSDKSLSTPKALGKQLVYSPTMMDKAPGFVPVPGVGNVYWHSPKVLQRAMKAMIGE